MRLVEPRRIANAKRTFHRANYFFNVVFLSVAVSLGSDDQDKASLNLIGQSTSVNQSSKSF